ncbi:MAG: Eco57I restriction-modification methylase domain-containing protein, partial [Muribaculaceae bacterium]|nr:Eco57I restriction-modification methylase domain-containing protein [Muribaculaceae bacterium]
MGFLRHLFHDGLNAPKHNDEFEHAYGRIPYLNGGMFDDHQIEREYANLDISDEAFERLFKFFNKWEWHLDTRITSNKGKDINPDVLGYIFEQYINDRAQMGAYYTKEDITEYIGRNCILPYLYDEVRNASKESAKDFEPDGFIWQTLHYSGDKYIFDAVKKGYNDFNDIPSNIRQGIITEEMRHEYSETPVGDLAETHVPLVELRKDWNTKTPERWGLPSEIWRETIARLQRCGDILAKINRGEIHSINDFITYNIDIRSFTHDLLAQADSRFIRNFYNALKKVTILDPTCGSGAFLFAALNILEPLYEVCIDRMQEFNRENSNLFKEELAEITDKYRSNIQYFIYKSIILRNLYGVDIMVEATEIAKLRLFLKMVAVVEVDSRADNMGLDPLPDIDFNIRCGNTLVGYANEAELNRDLDTATDILQILANQEFKEKIEEEMQKVAATYSIFKSLQLRQDEDMAAFKAAKADLRSRLEKLNDVLNRRLFMATQTDSRNKETAEQEDIFQSAVYAKWLKSHQPFHWLAEFYQIIQGNGGFDVIIGNPPYVTFTDKSLSYRVERYLTYSTKNLFALCAERFIQIISNRSSVGYIIPLSGMSIDGFEPLQKIMYKSNCSWNSFYSGDRNPSELFTGVKIRAGIYISRHGQSSIQKYVCRYIKFQASEREILFSKIRYVEYNKEVSAPKIPSELGVSIIDKINNLPDKLNNKFGTEEFVYYHAAPIHWGKCLSDLSKLKERNLNIADSYKQLSLNANYRDFTFVLLNSTLFFYYWIVYSDCYNLTKKYFNIHIPDIDKVLY